MTNTPQLSIILATHNRRDVVIRTLEHVHRCGLDRTEFEIIAVDNASSDGTPEAIGPLVDRVIALPVNKGSCAKSWGVDVARGRFVVFLDDDSWPRPGTLRRMMEHFDAAPNLGAAGFRVHLSDGSEECGALPNVFVGCGVGFRSDALRGVGGLDRTLFMQAEEYDLAFRLAGGGWIVTTFDDLHVEHAKTPTARRHERTTYFDTRNNLRILARYLPMPLWRVYHDDALQRYEWLAETQRHRSAFLRGRRNAAWQSPLDRVRFRNHRLSAAAFETFFRLGEVERNMASLASSGVRHVVFVEVGKNVYAFHHAAEQTGIEVAAIGDDRFAAPGRCYRGTPVLPLVEAFDKPHDALIVSNMASVFADQAAARAVTMTSAPVYNWYGRPASAPPPGFCSTPPEQRPMIPARNASPPCRVHRDKH